jgi:hypothetical protein
MKMSTTKRINNNCKWRLGQGGNKTIGIRIGERRSQQPSQLLNAATKPKNLPNAPVANHKFQNVMNEPT